MGAALSDFASQNAVLEKRLPEALDFLKRLEAVNSFTANRAGVLRNGEIVAAQFHDLGFFAERVPADNPGFGDHLFFSRPGKERAVLQIACRTLPSAASTSARLMRSPSRARSTRCLLSGTNRFLFGR